jgi:hypothetical protein
MRTIGARTGDRLEPVRLIVRRLGSDRVRAGRARVARPGGIGPARPHAHPRDRPLGARHHVDPSEQIRKKTKRRAVSYHGLAGDVARKLKMIRRMIPRNVRVAPGRAALAAAGQPAELVPLVLLRQAAGVAHGGARGRRIAEPDGRQRAVVAAGRPHQHGRQTVHRAGRVARARLRRRVTHPLVNPGGVRGRQRRAGNEEGGPAGRPTRCPAASKKAHSPCIKDWTLIAKSI